MFIKKIVAVACCMALTFCLAACNGSSQKETQQEIFGVDTGVDVGEYVAQGRLDIFEKISLKTKTDQLEQLYGEEAVGNFEYDGMSDISGKNHTYKMTNTARFYYNRDDVYAIACFADVFGLQIGVSTPKDVVATVGKAEVEKASSAELFIFPGTPDSDVIMYSFDKYEIRFYFENGYFSAALINDSSKFTPKEDQNTDSE